jgi:hypothetical protein
VQDQIWKFASAKVGEIAEEMFEEKNRLRERPWTGPDSLNIVKKMELYNPDKTWRRTDDAW